MTRHYRTSFATAGASAEQPAAIIARGATRGGPWMLGAWRSGAMRHVGIRDPEGQPAWSGFGFADGPGPLTRGIARFHGANVDSQRAMLIGHGASHVARVDYVVASTGVKHEARLFQIPGDPAFRAFILEIDDPESGVLVAIDSAGRHVGDLAIRAELISRDAAWPDLPLVADGRAGTAAWRLSAAPAGPSAIDLRLEVRDADRPAFGGQSRAGRLSESRAITVASRSRSARWNAVVGQVDPRITRVVAVLADETRVDASVAPMPDWPDHLFVVICPHERHVVRLEAYDKSGLLTTTLDDADPERPS